ncbi:MAG: hypothetical protein GDA56_30185 [Hormoscilla sp. GM7CHS1pb]|nr:hypothetical protein [Hormoscilla sp. GM7CHS1pb]
MKQIENLLAGLETFLPMVQDLSFNPLQLKACGFEPPAGQEADRVQMAAAEVRSIHQMAPVAIARH